MQDVDRAIALDPPDPPVSPAALDAMGSGLTATDQEVVAFMKEVLADIQSGEYAKSFILENKAGAPTLISRRRLTRRMMLLVNCSFMPSPGGTGSSRSMTAFPPLPSTRGGAAIRFRSLTLLRTIADDPDHACGGS